MGHREGFVASIDEERVEVRFGIQGSGFKDDGG